MPFPSRTKESVGAAEEPAANPDEERAQAVEDDSADASEDGGGEAEEAETARPETVARPPVVASVKTPLRADTRQQALSLLDQVTGYYRVAEPTSPVPILTEEARRIAERDFMTLLSAFLPETALRSTVPVAES